jgi:hypothetical protein
VRIFGSGLCEDEACFAVMAKRYAGESVLETGLPTAS